MKRTHIIPMRRLENMEDLRRALDSGPERPRKKRFKQTNAAGASYPRRSAAQVPAQEPREPAPRQVPLPVVRDKRPTPKAC